MSRRFQNNLSEYNFTFVLRFVKINDIERKWGASYGGTKIVSNTSVGGLIQRTLNRVDPRLADHGIRVAFIVSEMLRYQGKYPPHQQELWCQTAMLHDIGAYKTEEIDKME